MKGVLPLRVNVKARPARDKPRAMAESSTSMIWLPDRSSNAAGLFEDTAPAGSERTAPNNWR